MGSARPYRLIAFDPGERTGFVLVRIAGTFHPKRAAEPTQFRIENQGVFTISEAMSRGTRGLHHLMAAADIVAYEEWRLYDSHKDEMVGNDMQPSQVVGMIRYEAKRQSKRLVSNGADIKIPAVKSMPAWLVTHMSLSSEQHDKDAIMHAWAVAFKRATRSDP